jgi:hypothetical protein
MCYGCIIHPFSLPLRNLHCGAFAYMQKPKLQEYQKAVGDNHQFNIEWWIIISAAKNG